ncbi:hypothetical protein KZI27_01385 [Curtobacterium sp. TC1]|uniref:hypothetical protein n=1 Tax=Curtobacterium sp. TC1 TaxID=2862880 RepID=UPI001C9B5E11|nr:hypothetical protein [Curtobacterium sp. TC1]QZQ53702.1 hypothetical protein KZI27_00225 [Curtobacterium sp. TC1]QZQ55550.1 hypothetical protein KZI27_01385 [Curtobacterium sp. TC1]
MTAHPAAVLTCDTADCEHMIAVSGPSADTYQRARDYAATFGWVTADWAHDCCRDYNSRLNVSV